MQCIVTCSSCTGKAFTEINDYYYLFSHFGKTLILALNIILFEKNKISFPKKLFDEKIFEKLYDEKN